MSAAPEKLKAFKLRYEAGEPVKDLAVAFDIPIGSIDNWVRKSGAKKRSTRPNRRRGHIDQAKRDEIIRLYTTERFAYGPTAKRAHVSVSTVREVLREAGVQTRGPKGGRKTAKLSADQRVEIATRYDAGEGSPALAREFGITPRTVLITCRLFGVEIRTRSGNRRRLEDSERSEICEFYERDRLTPRQISETYNIPEYSVRSILRKQGIRLRGADQWLPLQLLTIYRFTWPDGRFYIGIRGPNAKNREQTGWNDFVKDCRAVYPDIEPEDIAVGVPAYIGIGIKARLIEPVYRSADCLNRRSGETHTLLTPDEFNRMQQRHRDWECSLNEEQRAVLQASRKRRALRAK
ncbi:MAG: hypothetical protein ISN29_05605 [Gammaproteobacteria bacterium AqS3]|nr:hypothetical protein [Gammaproteobacteria bacterium AqS3]